VPNAADENNQTSTDGEASETSENESPTPVQLLVAINAMNTLVIEYRPFFFSV